MVAWKECPEAQRAIADALPLLKRAKTVVIVEAQEGADGDTSLLRAGAFLARHGIGATTRLLAREVDVPKQLTDYARHMEADLIVAGAYGHGRLREWIFGGVTRELLTRPPVPCLLSH